MTTKLRSLFLLGFPLATAAAGLAACSGDSESRAAAPLIADAGGGQVDAAPAESEDASPPTASCAPPPSASKCGNDGAWVRGIARFDPTHFKKSSTKPALRIALRHAFKLVDGEEKIGGRLHMYKTVPIKDVAAGQVEFAIDMCGMGTSMWSDENAPFNLLLSIDENGNNDLGSALTNDQAIVKATPDPEELVKKVVVDVSCHAPSPCVDVTLDCTGGTSCTTIDPIDSCAKKTPGCGSDDAFCN